MTLARQRHAVFVDPAERVDLAGLDQTARRSPTRSACQPVGRASLVAGPPLRRPPFRADRGRVIGRSATGKCPECGSEQETNGDAHTSFMAWLLQKSVPGLAG